MTRSLSSCSAALVLLSAVTATSAQTAAKSSQAVPEEFFVACGVFTKDSEVNVLDKFAEVKREGVTNVRLTSTWLSNGASAKRIEVGPFKTRELAEGRLATLSGLCTNVVVQNATTLAQREKNRLKGEEEAQARRAAATARSGDGAYGYDYKYQQWKSCVERHSNQSWSSNQVGMGYAKCGDAPTP